MAWQRGPMPPGTWGWGGVVPVELNGTRGFFFADFKGDRVVTTSGRVLAPREVAWYDNSLTLPPMKEGQT